MSPLDWLIVVALNAPVIVYVLLRSSRTETSRDWFLAGRTLPWWIVGLSMYATAIDSSDMVVDSGGAYQFGVSMFVVNWIGIVGGWLLLAHWIGLPMYRAGMYTNAEYLEARFGLAARVISVLVQVLFRTMVLALLAKSMFLTLAIVLALSAAAAWAIVFTIALVATLYTVTGGLKAVAVTDAMQSFVMILASVIIFCLVFNRVGGWSGVERRLDRSSKQNAAALMHVGRPRIEQVNARALSDVEVSGQLLLGGELSDSQQTIVHRSPAWIIFLNLVIAGMAYAVVNHTQSMRMFGARSEWDFKMSAVLAGVVLIVVTFFNLSLGVMGRALYPTAQSLPLEESLQTVDAIFPVLVRDLAVSGLRGVMIAGIMAASFSTYDSIGSTLSALLTRDIYARLIVRHRGDRHYLAVGRWLTPVIIFGSFAYLPWISGGMFNFYLEMVATFVTPLLVLYLLGALTPVARCSGTLGLIAGVGVGVWSLIARSVAARYGVALLPRPLLEPLAAAPLSTGATAAVMLLASGFAGWVPRDERLRQIEVWSDASDQPAPRPEEPSTRYQNMPAWAGLAILAVGLYLTFVVFW